MRLCKHGGHRGSFYPRLREGGDLALEKQSDLIAVSIHASAREATRYTLAAYSSDLFLSTPPRGRRR